MSSPAEKHRRVYQACEPCREKKVRCELGSVDCPSKPPCARCRRESKECFFAASRIRKNASTKRKAQSPLVPEPIRSQPATSFPDAARLYNSNLTPGLQEEEGQKFPDNGRAATALLEGHPRTYHDALTLLSKACEHSEAQKGTIDGLPLTNRPPSVRPHPSDSPLGSHTDTNINTNEGTDEALCAWSNLRFVRGGLFTAEEALDMVDHFYNFQSAFSPVVPEYYRCHSQHAMLIEEEPVLTIVILMIGSRYRKWSGPAAVARSYIVHDRIWRYLQGMLSRLFWSEDLFVGEFPSLKGPRPAYTDSWSHGFRTLGTCEALLLLLDWHPRALHFPPPDEDMSSIVIPEPKRLHKRDCATGYYGPGSGHDWLARSDRLCHSMLSTVLMLATEMGIFCEDRSFWQGDEIGHDHLKLARDQERLHRIRCLIWVYATQQPGRPGRRNPTQCTPKPSPSIKNDDATECWMRVATIMKNANDLLFVSPRYTGEIIRNGEYLQIVRGLEPLLNQSLIEFDYAKLAKQTRYILTIEYEYAQVCVFGLALQAAINRNCGDNTSSRLESCSRGASTEEEKHLRVTVRAARTVLRTVLDDLLPHGSLTYIPVRSYSRILGAILILLKCCAARISDVNIPMSLDLVRRVAVGLRDSAIDDTHLSTRWGNLLENLASRLQTRLTQRSTPKTCNVRLPTSAALSNHNADASQVSNEIHRSTIHDDPQGIQARAYLEDNDILDLNRSSSDANQDPQSDAWSTWWDDQFSQVNLNYMPWFPTLGLVGGSDPLFFSDAADGLFESAGPAH
ncbi:uncharacterized protein N7482_004385 [Penicillium canariense]|uniref:Zn(2)-C6 fungal-type domain-containing protein n=1 Tax=Penicillium canariense TaxID=189055 RepID=A0A9W9LQ15_9EURO|nr:uncharacterized protein N7482_004385 [Penicillium canariense]KAJ5168791.1 hypothetical protein N7482_004385 [Penicillium canariense]